MYELIIVIADVRSFPKKIFATIVHEKRMNLKNDRFTDLDSIDLVLLLFGTMTWILPIALMSYLAVINAYIPNVDNLNNHGQSANSHVEPGHLSLPNLLEISDITDLSLNWEFYNNIRYDTGRLLYETGNGALWSTPQLANTKDEWTIETVFRYTVEGTEEDPNNGLSLWLIDPANSDPIDAYHNTNYGGPSRYDGFQFLISSQETAGLRIFAQDGSSPLTDTSLAKSLGSCDFNYLESDIPVTIRVSYSKSRNFFKVQVDNNLCFRTELISIPQTSSDFKFGVTGALKPTTKNYFELFAIKVWGTVTPDAIDDHGLITSGALDTEVPPKGQDKFVTPSALRKSLMERQMEQHQQRVQQQNLEQADKEQLNFDELYEKLLKIELAIGNLHSISSASSDSGSGSSEELRKVEAYIRDIQEVESKQAVVLRDLQMAYTEFKSTLTSQYGNLLDLVSKLNERVMGEVREQQHGMNEIGKKVDLLMANHKEVLDQYQNSSVPISTTQTTVFYWLLIVAFFLAFGFVVYKYQEKRYKHSKIL